MLVAKRFVFVHQAKTGGTFVAATLKELHRARGEQVPFVICDVRGRPVGRRAALFGPAGRFGRRPGLIELHHTSPQGQVDQHGTAAQIAPWFGRLPIVGCTRNPYDTLVSHYEFRWWVTHVRSLGMDLEAVMARWPHFPDLSFADYLELSHRYFGIDAWQGGDLEDRPGQATRAFLRVYARDPEAYAEVAVHGRTGGDPQRLLAPVQFLRTEALSSELADLLATHGYSEDEVTTVRRAGRVFPPEGGRSDDKRDWRPYFTPELKALVRHRERVLFELFPEYDR